jgi:GNAT superfamily N-acetyltransferase
MSLIIRPARSSDADVICEFNRLMAKETENLDLNLELVGPGVKAMLADANKGRYFVAELDGQVVGQVGYTCEWRDWRNGYFWWIQSVYVASPARRQGVFTRLLREVVAAAHTQSDVIGVRLYVEHDNAAAQATYRKLGFTMTNYNVMEMYPIGVQ